MFLSLGEQMVWAAAYVEAINARIRQSGRSPNEDERALAVMDAAGMVNDLRIPLPTTGNYVPSPDAVLMFDVMRGKFD